MPSSRVGWGDLSKTLRYGSLAVLLAVATVLGLVIYALARTSLGDVSVSHLTVKPGKGHTEGVLISFPGADSSYATSATGVRVVLPTASGGKSSDQSGVSVVGGQHGLRAEGVYAAGVSVVKPASSGTGLDVQDALSSQLVAHNGVNALS
jgi:putative exporter of polyketide antibiotics